MNTKSSASKPHIFVTSAIPKPGLEKLAEYFRVTLNSNDRILSRQELSMQISTADALLCLLTDTIDKSLIEAGKNLKVISNYAVGFNNIDIAEATKRKIPVCITPGILTNATADLTWALILAVTRRIVEADQFTRAHLFKGWSPNLFLGSDLENKTLGIIGMGRIGQAVAIRGQAFGMKIVYYSRHDKHIPNTIWLPLEKLLEISDIVSLHTPLSPETHHLIDAPQLNSMRKTAYLINTTRGPVVNEQALLAALRAQRIAGAGLDVYEHEPLLTPGLTELTNVVLLPHIGSATVETRTKMAILAAENAIAVLQGRAPHAIANPEVFR